MEEVLVVGEPGADSDDGGREQAGRVSWREKPKKKQSRLFLDLLLQIFSDPPLQIR